jgi:UDP-N-acetylglucosamine--N-acetylmuramyl-(pentapeptide) pyrophosphoryl-undecaprenol N-acetylglucosamine transferase
MSLVSAHRHLVVMAAGTGGHVMPGLAVARQMQQRGWTVSWLGTPAGMENKLVPPSGIEIDRIGFSGLRGKGLLGAARGALALLASLPACVRIFRSRHADVVLGMGGYVCLPGGWMAALLRKPLVLVNADAALLLSNKALAPLARHVAFGFEGEAAARMPQAVVTGNPVRGEIAQLTHPAQRLAGRTGPLRLLVVGGSLGAKVLNETLPKALALMPVDQRPSVTHQTGAAHFNAVQAAYQAAGVQAEVVAFIDDMAKALSQCDGVVCRAGAITVSELCAAGVASILVPLVVSTTAHQRDNAQWIAARGAAIHLPQAELTPQALADLLTGLSRDALQTMATRARELAQPEAAARVAELIEACAPTKA